ncbi:MAG TPA: type II toxin-antitoxin system PemK/MazF family toxin [Terriglobales bacterium]|jgi:mRNA interferase MazF|nr:type II toxin-antitoxin system PemK/MazF family toxin [Terriglobales bacterium]
MVGPAYVPDKAHIIKINFDPQAGHEQAGWRPAVVLSPAAYNRIGLAIVVPITNQVKGYPFEVPMPSGTATTGVILSDAIKSVDWKARHARFVEILPPGPLKAVQGHLRLLLRFP